MNQENIGKIRQLWESQKIHKVPSVLFCLYKGDTYLTTRDHQSVSFFVKRYVSTSGESQYSSWAAVTRKCILTKVKIGSVEEQIYEVIEDGALQVVSSSKPIDEEGIFAATVIETVFPISKTK